MSTTHQWRSSAEETFPFFHYVNIPATHCRPLQKNSFRTAVISLSLSFLHFLDWREAVSDTGSDHQMLWWKLTCRNISQLWFSGCRDQSFFNFFFIRPLDLFLPSQTSQRWRYEGVWQLLAKPECIQSFSIFDLSGLDKSSVPDWDVLIVGG